MKWLVGRSSTTNSKTFETVSRLARGSVQYIRLKAGSMNAENMKAERIKTEGKKAEG